MMALKRMKVLALILSLLALILTVSAFAETDEGGVRFFIDEAVFERDSFAASGSYTGISQATADALIEYLYIHVKNAEMEIDVSQFKVPWGSFDDTRTAWKEMTHIHRDVEYYAGAFTPGGSSDSTGRYVGKLKVTNYKAWNDVSGSRVITQSEILSTNAAIDAKVDEIVAQVPAGTSDLEKVLIVHDWLCVNGEYDTVRLANGTIPRTSYDLRGILLYQIGVCQSYTWAFDYIMDRFGIQCINVTSDDMNHTWNQVQVGGYWYNMDITWDDPTDDKIGLARHYYFLCSDSAFQNSRRHYGYSDGVPCNSTKYDNAFWYDVDTPMPYLDGAVFYLKQTEGIIKSINIDTMSSIKTLRTVTDGWYWHYNNRNGYKAAYFTNLAEYAGRIYFNDAESIAYMNPDGSGYTTIKSFSTSDNNQNVYGMRINGDSLEYVYVYDIDGILRANGSINLFIPITSIKLPFTDGKLKYGYYAIIDVTVNSGADASRIIWNSSDPSVATVSAGGRVDSERYGTTVITATSPDDPSVKATMNLTIYEPTTSISLSGNPSTLVIGSTRTLKVKLNTGALTNDIVWTSSNSNVVSVDSNGVVTAKAYGTATITAKSYENSSIYTTLKITVADAQPGDPNGDGRVDATDAVCLAQFLAGWATGYDMSIADVNCDGKVNATDAVAIAQFLAGWNVTLG